MFFRILKLEQVDKLGEHNPQHQQGGVAFVVGLDPVFLILFLIIYFCMRPVMEAVNDAVVREDLVVVKNVDFKDEEDSVLAEKVKKIVPDDVIDGQ